MIGNKKSLDQMLNARMREIDVYKRDHSRLLYWRRHAYYYHWQAFYYQELSALEKIRPIWINKLVNALEEGLDKSPKNAQNKALFEKYHGAILQLQKDRFVSDTKLIGLKLILLAEKCESAIEFCDVEIFADTKNPLDFNKLHVLEKHYYFAPSNPFSQTNPHEQVFKRLRDESKDLLFKIMITKDDRQREEFKNNLIILIKVFKQRCLNNDEKNIRFFESFKNKVELAYGYILKANKNNENIVICQQSKALLSEAMLETKLNKKAWEQYNKPPELKESNEYKKYEEAKDFDELIKGFLKKNIGKFFDKLDEALKALNVTSVNSSHELNEWKEWLDKEKFFYTNGLAHYNVDQLQTLLKKLMSFIEKIPVTPVQANSWLRFFTQKFFFNSPEVCSAKPKFNISHHN